MFASSTAAVVLATSGVAYGYWTTSGSGSGTARVAAAQTLSLHASTVGALSPGGSLAVFFTVDNPGPTGLRVGTVHLAGVTADSEHRPCSVADFAMADVLQDQTIPANSAAVALATSGLLVYADTSHDQSACKGATLTLHVTSD
ncbi:MAG: hypothetical protein ACR2N4_04620 [Jatrophihabitans sp.]